MSSAKLLKTMGAMLLGAIFQLEAPVAAQPEPARPPSASGIEISLDKSKVDLKAHRLELKINHVADKITIKVLDESGVVLADEEHDFSGQAPGTPLVVTWNPSSDAAVARIELYAYDEDGAYKGVALMPWSV